MTLVSIIILVLMPIGVFFVIAIGFNNYKDTVEKFTTIQRKAESTKNLIQLHVLRKELCTLKDSGIKTLYNEVLTIIDTKIDMVIKESNVDFSIWLQDNYSQNKKQGSTEPLPKGKMRKDFSNEIYNISELWDVYLKK